MKKVLSILLALCLLVGVLPMAASARGQNRYTAVIEQLIKERLGNKTYWNRGRFYDLDGDGIEELLILRSKNKDYPVLHASLYTIVDGEAVCLLKDEYVTTEVGSGSGCIKVLDKGGNRYFGLYSSGGNYGDNKNWKSVGSWDLYRIDRTTGKLNKTNTASYHDSRTNGVATQYGTIDGKRVTLTQYKAWEKSFTAKSTVDSSTGSTFEQLLRIAKADTTGDLPTTTVGGFKDVFVESYYANAVKWAVDNGITAGVSANKFGPAENCRREQIVTFLWRCQGEPEPQSIAGFADMPANETFRKAISWAAENGITTGEGNNRFGSSNGCTRAQAMTFIWRALGRPEPKGTAAFTDLPQSEDMRKAISWAAENGITSGVSSTQFGSNQTCKREQIVTFLYKASNLQK